MNRILRGVYSQQGYADKIGKDKSTVSRMVKNKELELVFTEDGKPLIKA